MNALSRTVLFGFGMGMATALWSSSTSTDAKLISELSPILSGTWEFARSSAGGSKTCTRHTSEVWLITIRPSNDGRRLEGLLGRSNIIRANYTGESSKGAQRCFALQSAATAEYVVKITAERSRCEHVCFEAALIGCKGDCKDGFYQDKVRGQLEIRTTSVLALDGKLFSKRQ